MVDCFKIFVVGKGLFVHDWDCTIIISKQDGIPAMDETAKMFVTSHSGVKLAKLVKSDNIILEFPIFIGSKCNHWPLRIQAGETWLLWLHLDFDVDHSSNFTFFYFYYLACLRTYIIIYVLEVSFSNPVVNHWPLYIQAGQTCNNMATSGFCS